MFDFNFDFLTPEQNAFFFKSMNCFYLQEVKRLNAELRAARGKLREYEDFARRMERTMATAPK